MGDIGGMLLQGTIFSLEVSRFLIIVVDINSVVVRADYQQVIPKFNIGYPLFGVLEGELTFHLVVLLVEAKDPNPSVLGAHNHELSIRRNEYAPALGALYIVISLFIFIDFEEILGVFTIYNVERS